MKANAALPQGRKVAGENASAATRSELYAFLSRLFSFPDVQMYPQVLNGCWLQDLTARFAGLPYSLKSEANRSWAAPSDYEQFQSEYIRLFEVGGRGGSPCPLHSGHYSRDRLRTMEELIRFYNFFGLRIAPGMMPDHVSAELEFMHYLAGSESETGDGAEQMSYLRAQRDFLLRHLLNWWPLLAVRVKRERPIPFFRSLVTLTGRFLQTERAYVESALRAT